MGRALKQAGITAMLFGALVVAGCTSIPTAEPPHPTKHRHKILHAKPATKPVKRKRIVATRDETAPVITPLGGGGNGGGGAGGW